MPAPINPVHRLLLEDNVSYLLLEDNASKLILDEQIALDDPLNAGTVSTVTPGLTFQGNTKSLAFVQSATPGTNAAGATATTTTSAFTAANTAHNAIIVGAIFDNESGVTSVIDTIGNTYTLQAKYPTTGNRFIEIWACYDILSAFNNQITLNQAFNDGVVFAHEYSGLQSSMVVDQIITATNTNASPTATTASLTQANELVIGILELDILSGNTIDSVGAGYSNFQSGSSNNVKGAIESKIVTSAGAQTATFNITNAGGASWRLLVITFKAQSLTYEVEVDTVNTFDSNAGGTTTYYINGYLGITNNVGAWGSPSNAFDGNTATDATATGTSTTSVGFLYGQGTNSPTTGTNITQVRARIYGGVTGNGASVGAQIYTASLTETLGSVFTNATPAAQAYGSYVVLTAPAAGWTWATVSTLEAKIFCQGSSVTTVDAAKVDIEVTYAGTPILDKTSNQDIGFVDNTDNSLGDDRLLLEDGTSYLLLEDNASKLAINYSYPSAGYLTYTVPSSTLSTSITYYWRARDKVQNGGSYGSWSETRSFIVSAGTSISITQVAANVTATGGTQAIATSNFVAITQVAATVTAAGGTQVVTAKISTSVAQVAASVTASGGTQAIATVNIVAISQLAATVTAAGGTQAIATSNFIALTQLAATVTATGGTQLVQANSSNAQVAATVTATGGTQAVAAVGIVALAQIAGAVTASGGTQTIATVNNVSITQVGGSITASGGVQAIATVNSRAISQLAATASATGGTQSIQTNSSNTQQAGAVTASGGTQVINSVNIVSLAQSAASVTAGGGTQAVASVNMVLIAQLAATTTASGGTQAISTVNNVTINQLAATGTAAGGTQSLGAEITAVITQVAGVVTASGGTQTVDSNQFVVITQANASVTASGGVQGVQTNALIAQIADSLTATGGTQAVVSMQNIAIAQVVASVIASGGTQAIATVNFVDLAPLAGAVTAGGGVQVLDSAQYVALTQIAGGVVASGGTQVVASGAGSLTPSLGGAMTLMGVG